MKKITLRLDTSEGTVDEIDQAVIAATIRDALRMDPTFNSICATFLASHEVRISWDGDGASHSVAVHTPMEVDDDVLA